MQLIDCGRDPNLIFAGKMTVVMLEPEQKTPTGAVMFVPTGHGQLVLGFEGAQDERAEGLPSS